MAWVIVEDGAVVREFNRPTAFTYKDLQYPRNWIQNATAEEKSAIGLVEVTISGGQKSSDYYDNTLGNLVVAGDGSVSKTWSSTARTLSTVKSEKIKEAKRNANSELSQTDWYVIRKSETDVAVPSEITAYRTAVRTCYGNLKTAINAESDVDGVAALYGTTGGDSNTALPSDYKDLIQYFHSLLQNHPMILTIDSLDQLSNSNEERSKISIFTGVRPHPQTRIVVSCLPDEKEHDDDKRRVTALCRE